MKVLVVAKTTNLELHGESIRKRVSSGLLTKDNLHRLQKGHEDHYHALKSLQDALDAVKEIGRAHV